MFLELTALQSECRLIICHCLQLIPTDTWMLKCLQLHEATVVRHGIMLIGPPVSGKSTMISTLAAALSAQYKRLHRVVVMNPKAVSAEQMFGECDRQAFHSVLACILLFAPHAKCTPAHSKRCSRSLRCAFEVVPGMFAWIGCKTNTASQMAPFAILSNCVQ